MLTLSSSEISTYYAARVPGVKQIKARSWRGPCPVHGGKDDNFAVDPQTGMAHCHSQCGRGWDVLGLEMDLERKSFPEAKKAVFDLLGRKYEPGEQNFVATYDYADPDGEISYQVVRMYPKEFKQRHVSNGGWAWGLNGTKPLPFNLPAVNLANFCVLVEGEADVLCLKSHGIVASCNSGGAGNWKPDLDKWFEGKRLLLIPDNDDPGREHVLKVAARLAPKAEKVKILELPGLPEKGDVRDWFTRGGTVPEFLELMKTHALDWHEDFKFVAESPEDKWVNGPEQIIQCAGGMESAWDLSIEDGIPTPYPYLTEALAGGLRKEEVYYLAGRRGSGKTSMLLQFVAKALAHGEGVLMFSLEMRDIDVLRRLIATEHTIDLAQMRILQKKRKAGTITPGDMDLIRSIEYRAKKATDDIKRAALKVHQKPVVTPEYIVSETHRLVNQCRIGLVVVDHMQLMGSDGDEKKEYDKFTSISRALKGKVARELGLPILVASQVTRGHAADKRDELEITDMRGSGALEEDAAGIMLLYHDSKDAAEAKTQGRLAKGPVEAVLKLGKNRFGPSPCYLSMLHHKKYTRFDHEPKSTEEQEETA